MRRPHRTATVPPARAGALLLVGVLLTGCDLGSTPSGTPSPTAGATALGSEPPDPRDAALTAALEDLRSTVVAAREALVAAGTAEGAGGQDAADLAVALLAADAELAEAEEDPDPRPLFPGPETSRVETIDYGDAFSEALSAARAAGQAGAPVLDLLRDPVAGDIGVWQRDAAGVLDELRSTARDLRSEDLPTAEASIAELDGEGPKALVWALLAADAWGPEERAAYAERGAAHLDVILDAVDGALDDRGPADGQEDT